MTDESRIMALLEQILDTDCTPDEACRECPDLLPIVRERLKRFRTIEAEVVATFPPRNESNYAHAFLDGTERPVPSIPGYEFEKVVGSGGMGVVYKARQSNLDRVVAIKMLLAGGYAGPHEVERFRREGQAIAALRHPNIVQVFDAGCNDGFPYFAMEFMDGGRLSEALAGVPQPARHAAETVAMLARAVHAAHERGIVHRDLKPANVLLTSDGTMKIADFGLARRLDANAGATLTLAGAHVGTPSYMSPEQAIGAATAFGPCVDVYALGAILYEMLTGRPPFRGESPVETQRQVISTEPPPPSQLNARVPRDLETICLKCLQKEPNRRYAAAGQLADDLGRFLRNEPIQARRVGPAGRFVRWARRNPASAALIAAGIALFALVIGVTLREWTLKSRARVEKARLTARLDSAIQLEHNGQLSEARAIIGQLGDGGFHDLRERIDRAVSDLELADALDRVRLSCAESGQRNFDRANVDAAYQTAFRSAGIDVLGAPPSQIAATIATSNVRKDIVVAIDDWSFWSTEQTRRVKLAEIARLADPDPAWRDRMRNPAIWSDPAALKRLADTAVMKTESAPLLVMLARLIESSGQDALDVYRRVQFAHPDDFFANFLLAETLGERGQLENAIGFFRAALVARPKAVAAYVNIGTALSNLGRWSEAMDYWRQALVINPNSPMVHLNLAIASLNQNLPDEASRHADEMLRLEPQSGKALAIKGQALLKKARYAEAQSILQRCLELLPEADVMRPEATRTKKSIDLAVRLGERLPAIVRGEAKPDSAEECLEIAFLLRVQTRFGASARHYDNAFSDLSHSPEDKFASYRYDAACTAALAGAGKGEDAAELGDEQRAHWRKQARVWLQADLEKISKMTAANQQARDFARQQLSDWRVDPDLAGIRDPDSLGKLPQSERDESLAFWASVASVLARF